MLLTSSSTNFLTHTIKSLQHGNNTTTSKNLDRSTLEIPGGEIAPKPIARPTIQHVEPHVAAFAPGADKKDVTKEGDFMAKQACGVITEMFQGKNGPVGFMGKSEPALELECYMFRIHRYAEQWATPIHGPHAGTSLRAFSMATELLSRLQDVGYAVCKRTAHRLFLVAVLVSIKCTEDFVISNKFWAKVGGISLEELNMLELEFCKLLNWNVAVSPSDTAVHREKYIEPAF